MKGCRWTEWYSKQLTAFTLADLIEVNLRMKSTQVRNFIPRLQVAVTDARDPTSLSGTNAGGHRWLSADREPEPLTTST